MLTTLFQQKITPKIVHPKWGKDGEDCFFYDEPGQEAFVIQRGNKIYIAIENAQKDFIELPSFNKESSDTEYFKIARIEKFKNPKDGFDIVFVFNVGQDRTSVQMIKKIFIKKLLGINHNQSDKKSLVASSSTTSMKAMNFTWLDQNTDQWKPVPMGVAVWHRDITPDSNAEYELEVNDIVANGSRLVGHLYHDGTLRVTEISPEHAWLVNVRPFTGWICYASNLYFLVANHSFRKKIVSVAEKNILIDLPFLLSSGMKITKAFTKNDDEDNDEDDDTFYVVFEHMDTIPHQYSIDTLIKNHQFIEKYKTQKISGVWLGKSRHNGNLYADFSLWPDVDIEMEPDHNKARQNALDKSTEYGSDIMGHCYPMNKRINISVKQEGLFEKYIESTLTGTYHEIDNDDKNGAIVAVVDNALYVMMNQNFEAEKNLHLPFPEGYKTIQFTKDEVAITYEDKVIKYSLNDLVQKPKIDFMLKHQVLNFAIEPKLSLDVQNGRRKCIVYVWKNLTVQDNLYNKEIDKSNKHQYAKSWHIKPEDIDVAHLYLQDNRLCIVNNYDGRARGPSDVNKHGWMLETESDTLILIETDIDFIFTFISKDKAQQTFTMYQSDFLNINDIYPHVESISLDESKNNFVMKYTDRFDHLGKDEKYIFHIPVHELKDKCKLLSEREKQLAGSFAQMKMK